MSADEIVLTHGIQVTRSFGSFSAFNAYLNSDGTIEVKLSVHGDTDYLQWFRLGDTFPVSGQTWKIEDVENASEEDWVVYLVRVD